MDCPKCKKKMAGGGHKCNAPKVIQIEQAPEIVTYHTVEIPASMGDETTVPPVNGKYRNTILRYEASGSVYLYNSDGIPVSLTPDQIRDFNLLTNRPKYDGEVMTSQTNIPNVEPQINAIAGGLAAETLARTNADDAINDAIDKSVLTDIVVDTNPSTSEVKLDTTKTNIKTSVTTTGTIPLPVVSATQAGVLNSATYNAISQNRADINALMNGAVAISGLSASPSQNDLTTAWESETGLTSLMNRAGIYDIDNDKVWTYYSNTDTWYPSANTPSIVINPFTNNSLGTIKGSTNVGQVFAENDGTGSVNGWDALNATVSNHTSQLANKVDESELADYSTIDYTEDRMMDTWQLVGSAEVPEDTTAYEVCQIDIPAEWQGVDVDYKFSASLEYIGADRVGNEAFPYLLTRGTGGRALSGRFGYIRLLPDGTVYTWQTPNDEPSRHAGFEFGIRLMNDSCVAEGIISHPHNIYNHWNHSGTAAGISEGRPAVYNFGGRLSTSEPITGFALHASADNFVWAVGTHLEIYARRHPRAVSA